MEKGKHVELIASLSSMMLMDVVDTGFDVQAELQMRGASPTTARPQHPTPASPNAPIVQQAIMNRHQQAMRHPAGVATPKIDQAFEAAPMQPMRISPSATSQAHSHTPTSSQFPSPAQTYRASPGAFPAPGQFIPQGHQAQPHQPVNEVSHHQQQQQPSQYQYNTNTSWGQAPFRGQDQQFEQHDVSSYGYSDMNSYNTVPGMAEQHPSQMHYGGAQPIGKLTRPFSMSIS